MSNLNYPNGGCGCVGECGHGITGSLGTEVQNPAYVGDQIGQLIIRNGGLETNFIYKDPFSLGMAGLLFDIKKVKYADGTVRLVYTLKGGLGSKSRMKSVAISKRNGCCVVVWYEGSAINTNTSLAAAAAIGDEQICLTDATAIGGIATPMSLVIKDPVSGKRITVTIVGIDQNDPNCLILKEPLTCAISTEACVYRGHYNPAAGCTNTYKNNVSFYNNDQEYHSYFTRIIQTLSYNNKCMINQTYLADLLSGGGNGKEYAAYKILQSNFSQQLDEAMQQFIRSAFWHKNTCGDEEEYGETYGLLTALKKVHDSGVPQFFDLSVCCDAEKCDAENAEALIKTFLKIIQSRAQLSPYMESKRVVVAINSDMLESLMDLRKYFEMFTGEIRIIEQTPANANDIISPRRKAFRVEDRGYEIVFLYEPVFDEIPNEFGLVMPEDTMGVFTFKNDYVEAGPQGPRIVSNQQQLVAGDTLKFKMWKDERTNNMVDGCTDFTMWLEYAIVWLYVDKCVYAGITNFALCNEDVDCHDCDTLSDVPFDCC